ncbi:type I-E CRISPR-associated endoribonuclease Cas2e [Nocardiopsis sp. NPDC057823]|uniref:type I-E CRISPR-associated endoribonuclease Cas2e n=1 Tax=Nocardiopsis TaxID=2013 RepID=UPI00366B3B50
MGSMVVISTTAVPDRVRGALSRWMIEPDTGLYVGTMNARVRERLWAAVSESVGDGAAVCLHTVDNEQGYVVLTAGERRRRVVDFDGLQLVRFTAPVEEEDPAWLAEAPEGMGGAGAPEGPEVSEGPGTPGVPEEDGG